MDIAVIVASTNRPEEIEQLLSCLSQQTKRANKVVLSVTSETDLPNCLPSDVDVILGPPGLTVQRNRGLERVLGISDVVVFYDDDFLPTKDSLAGIERLFSVFPNIVSATGEVLYDGVKIGGISHSAASAIVNDYERVPTAEITTDDILWAYGCNMAFRSSAIGSLRFDENLPLHGWQEDMDFVARLAKYGDTVKTNAFAGVHRGVNKRRSPGFQLGFSQIVNPVYLVQKGAMSGRKAANLMVRNFLANHIKALRPEPFIDRRGRMLGNWLGIFHVLRGPADPKAMLQIH